MALQNAAELITVLGERRRLGQVFARHAYGMGAWTDLFAARIPTVADPAAKALLATLVADNARHMLLFRERAAAHGVDPDLYECPPEGLAIYDRIPELGTVEELAGYALGSLEHFGELLDIYSGVAGDDDGRALETVLADVDRMRDALRPLQGAGGRRLASEAHERYRVRELAEAPRYAHAG